MSRYGQEYWDKYGSYRTPIAFHLSILVLLRAYFIWVIEAISRRPELDLMSLFFKSKSDFFVAIAIGAVAIIPAILFCLRKPRDSLSNSDRLAKMWRYMRWPLILCAVIDLTWLSVQAGHSHYRFSLFLAIQMVVVLWVLWYLAKSRYLTVFFNDWPEPTEKAATEQKPLKKDT
jgi:small-conductance mechanosensitive channel